MIEKIGNPLDEQETVINIAPVQVREKAYVYTSIPHELNRLWKLHEQYPDEVEISTDDKYGTEFIVPRDWVKIKPKRQLSEEQRRIAAERLAAYRR